MEQMIFEVSQVNQYLKDLMDGDPLLGSLCIRGEISNYKVYPSGHHYFSLKDPTGAIRCVMFKGSAFRLRFRPENGMKVLATGRITVFPRDGAYQLYCEQMTPDGVGDLYVAFEQLKKKLLEQGLFDAANKKPLPEYPHRIAIITSSAGAAVHDMLRIIRKRYPLAKVLLLPVRVQGAEAPMEICGAIRYANRYQIADVLITGRGGGSIEDLWAFNDERVAQEIFRSDIPVVSAVGHEPDVTISDFVADLRAATPSNGAELVTPDQLELRQRLSELNSSMRLSMTRRLQFSRQQLNALHSRRCLQSPENYVQEKRLLLDNVQHRMVSAMQRQTAGLHQKFGTLTAALDAMSPLKVLTRGYSVVKTENGTIIKACKDVKAGGIIDVTVQDGTFTARVLDNKEK